MTDLMEEDLSSGIQSSEEEDPNMAVESLISGRAKRSTAGRHMSALIDAAVDDDLTLLFQEVEDDNEFAEEAEAGAAEEDDVELDSSDDEDDQGPDAQNDYEGEQALQKEERKKRRAQNDLRFQTLRKRVKIDPTAVSAVSAIPAPRPKKKSERISWIPTPEDGPTRSSSRRQTMVNKELTHARLKDSQEKRVRIIATMKEAEKRKAHLKPKGMTQDDHLAEAARIERLNSKSVNRWEQTEKRKAEERRARIEALQNRRLQGPVMSYWSGLATWTNGRLTRVGKVDIRLRPEKDEPKKKKKGEEKGAAESQSTQSATPAPAQPQQPVLNAPAQLDGTSAPAATAQSTIIQPSDQKPPQDIPIPGSTTAPLVPGSAQPSKPEDDTLTQPPARDLPVGKEENKTVDSAPPTPASKLSQMHPVPVVEIPTPPKPNASAAKESPAKPPSTENVDLMEIDQTPPQVDASKTDAAQQPAGTEQTNLSTVTSAGTPAVSGGAPPVSTGSSTTDHSSQPVTHQPTPATTPLGPQAPAVTSADAAPMHATAPETTAIQGHQPGATLQAPLQSHAISGPPTQPEIPPPPPVIEHTGRNLTILENFDDKTAHSKKYSMYFNARKPPRLASTLHDRLRGVSRY